MTPAAFRELGGTITPIRRNPPERKYLAEVRAPDGSLLRFGYGKDEQDAVTAAYSR
jgi:hypothetical protein